MLSKLCLSLDDRKQLALSSQSLFLLKKYYLVHLLIFLFVTASRTETLNIKIPPTDPRLKYEGRWILNETTSHGDAALADWPCSSIHFNVEVDYNASIFNTTILNIDKDITFAHKEKTQDPSQYYVEISMFNLRTRMVARITPLVEISDTVDSGQSNPNFGNGGVFQAASEQYILGPSFSRSPPDSDIYDFPKKLRIDLPQYGKHDTVRYKKRNFLISLRKLSEAEPYGSGIGDNILRASVAKFYGISETSTGVTIIPIEYYYMSNTAKESIDSSEKGEPDKVHIEFVGASDTAGYCVDGTPDTGIIDGFFNGWKYGNCDYGMPGRITKILSEGQSNETTIEYTYSVIASAGIGLVQNANHAHEWVLGPKTMMDYYDKMLMSQNESTIYNNVYAKISVPTLTVISLGGNDYNHQNGDVPTQEEFSEAFAKFLNEKLGLNERNPMLQYKRALLICGMGWPQEVDQDPDNNRCRPCPYVEQAAKNWNSNHSLNSSSSSNLLVGYQFIPCDGSVVPNQNGYEDMGCMEHKNRHGQLEVAKFLHPRIKEEIQILLKQKIG